MQSKTTNAPQFYNFTKRYPYKLKTTNSENIFSHMICNTVPYYLKVFSGAIIIADF